MVNIRILFKCYVKFVKRFFGLLLLTKFTLAQTAKKNNDAFLIVVILLMKSKRDQAWISSQRLTS